MSICENSIEQILWSGHQQQSIEFCTLSKKPSDIEVSASIICCMPEQFCKLDYSIFLHPDWSVNAFTIEAQFSKEPVNWWLNAEKGKHWTISHTDGNPFSECIDIDISLTPFTNTLPLKRLQLKTGETASIKVLYLDILEKKLSTMDQLYTRLSSQTYKFQSPSTGFEAVIEVDENLLIVDYPGWFSRKGYKKYK